MQPEGIVQRIGIRAVGRPHGLGPEVQDVSLIGQAHLGGLGCVGWDTILLEDDIAIRICPPNPGDELVGQDLDVASAGEAISGLEPDERHLLPI